MELLQSFGAVALVLAMLGAVLFALKKRGIASFGPAVWAPAGGKEMQVLERVSLGPQHCLHLVRVGETKCLVTTSPGACQVHALPPQTNL